MLTPTKPPTKLLALAEIRRQVTLKVSTLKRLRLFRDTYYQLTGECITYDGAIARLIEIADLYVPQTRDC